MKHIKKLTVAVCLASAMTASVNANIQQQVNSMFNSMVNVTAPGAYKTASLGVVTGGNITLRNRISTVNLVQITPPSAKGGCGGINMYMGSFSFINAEEFIGLMRNIAANAVGVASAFAFNMALEAMDSMTSGVIKGLRDTMQAMNQAMLNSCQLATGIVTETATAFSENRDLKAAAQGVMSNVTSDFFAGRRTSGESPAQRISESGAAKQCATEGNILWCAMRRSGFTNKILYGSQENAEFLMSMVGTYIVHIATDDQGGKTAVATPFMAIPGINLEIFVEGTQEPVQIYSCDETETCKQPAIRTLDNITGLSTKIVSAVKEAKLFERIKAGEAISPGEQMAHDWLFTSAIGVNVRALIDLHSPQVAYNYLDKYSKSVALFAAQAMINHQLEVVRGGVRELEMADKIKVEQDINRVQSELYAETNNLFRTKYAGDDPMGEFATYRDLARPRDQGAVQVGSRSSGSN